MSLLASLLGWRVPRADAMGLLGRNQLGVVLPDTSIAAAHEIAREVMEAAVEQREREFAYAVFVYPSHESAIRSDDDRAGKLDEPSQAYPLEAFFTIPLPRWKRLVDVTGRGGRDRVFVALAARDFAGDQARARAGRFSSCKTGKESAAGGSRF